MMNFKNRIYYRFIIGFAIIFFPITIAILLYMVISKFRMWLWCREHVYTPEEYEEELAKEGRIVVIKNKRYDY